MDEILVIEQVIACLQTLDEGKYVPTAMHTMDDAIIIGVIPFSPISISHIPFSRVL